MTIEGWTEVFYSAGIRREIANMAARIVVQRLARMRSEQMMAARSAGLTLSQIGAVFGVTKEGARRASTPPAGE